MKRTIKIARPASGAGTVVTVTLVENGVTVSFALKTFTSGIAASIRSATQSAEDMLRAAQEEIEREGQGA